MSASSKKKLRKEQQAATLTEKQRKEKKEAKNLKMYSIIFVAVMLVIAVIGITVLTINTIKSTGVIQKNTTAVTINEHKLDAIQLNYYYYDTINSTVSQWQSSYGDMASVYIAMMGLDMSKPLDTQYCEEGKTWADYFLEVAVDRAKADYTMYDLAMSEGFTMNEEQQANLEIRLANNTFYATMNYGGNVNDYLRAAYGSGASEKTFEDYATVSAIANAYYNTFCDSLTYDEETLRAHDAENFNNYTSYTFDSYYVTYNKYLPEVEKDEEGNVNYTEEQRENARAAAKVDADLLGQVSNTKELDEAIAALAVNKDSTNATSNKNKNLIYTSVPEALREWVSDEARVDGEVAVIPSYITTNNEDGTQNSDLYGYYVVIFHSSNDNTKPMSNVRHLLVKFEKDEDGNITNKEAAKTEADGYLKTWQEGAATEDSFIELVKAHSDDSSASTGGLFEDIYPGSAYVENFLNWSIDANRKFGDAEVIETEYGYHVMFYAGDSDLSYRDMLITNELKETAIDEWYNSVMEKTTVVLGDTRFVTKNLVLG